MAKIFRTEELSVNGDSIRISASPTNEDLVFNTVDAQGNKTEVTTLSSLMLRDLSHDSDISSLSKASGNQASDTSNDFSSLNKVTDSDISSLNVVTDNDISSLNVITDSDISSLNVVTDNDISSLNVVTDSDISSLNVVTDSDISSLESIVELNDIMAVEVVFSASLDNSTTDGSASSYDSTNALAYVKFPSEFDAAPKVVGLMKSAAGNPIIGCQLVSVATTHAVFAVSDDIALTDTTADQYSIQVLASPAGGKLV